MEPLAAATSIMTEGTMSAHTVGDTDLAAEAQTGAKAPKMLLLRHREGDEGAFGALVAEYRSPVYSYLTRCGVPSSDRDDLFQDVFLKIHRAADGFRSDAALHPWLFTIVANTVRNYFRRRRVRQLVFAGSEAQEAHDPAPHAPRVAEARQMAAWLEGQLARLPDFQRQVLLLVGVEGLTLQQTAKAMGVSVNTVKSRLRRARLTLVRARLERDADRDEDADVRREPKEGPEEAP